MRSRGRLRDITGSCCRVAAAYALLLLLLLTSPLVSMGAETVLLTTGEWPPYYSQNLPHGGLGNQIIAESFALEGIEVVYEYLPWRRALSEARTGPAVGSAGWLRLDEREKDFLFSESLFESQRVFFHRKDRPFDWTVLTDVQDLRVGVALGSADEYPLDGIMASGKGTLNVARSYASGMKMLAAGRIDVYACNLAVGLYEIKHSLSEKAARSITYHPRPIFKETNHLVLSLRVKDVQKLMDRFNRGLRRLKESPRYNEMVEFHLPIARSE
ncbi:MULTISPECIES: transporter substrate-binding domain-containing protein [unclassified Pseudodesulfovibrio]|uniref:substrate-binding periplasmic protein n=1 Tax=unclassified Pseudodesulfovibrio TaxID=2661612 RepID=UPI000FEB8C88|nr:MULTISPECIES: transporter substrate-binding domain-containing protein [unclassified Pseudodesulfovibrio]MCJ2164408.1 transporter substrate-binding domain-containing protein [Pseudodesulfovibrio sp. S3-i]RWU04614.1 amino acid ABC transporter substrate-binding protein [Pseudodesulfovibrio sp. S3]